ncbi:hypothetical protein evm_006890 [Chilo suppressalis]|nr:hypothetical protein evm_006890 [Chilo suppressalis]
MASKISLLFFEYAAEAACAQAVGHASRRIYAVLPQVRHTPGRRQVAAEEEWNKGSEVTWRRTRKPVDIVQAVMCSTIQYLNYA